MRADLGSLGSSNPADYQYFHGVPMPIEPSMLDTVVQLIERLGVSIAVVIMISITSCT